MQGMTKMRLIVGLVMAAFAVFSYFGKSSTNPLTGETQHVSMTQKQEISMGLASAPRMAQEFGGLHPDREAQAAVKTLGRKLLSSDVGRKLGYPADFNVVARPGAVSALPERGYPFDFHLLADTRTVNAFALPGGQIFVTAALFSRLGSEAQLAGVLGHEIGHVIERHSAERMAKQELIGGLTTAAAVGVLDPSSYGSQQVAQMVGNMISMKYGRDDELESDKWGVKLMAAAGYDPRAMIEVMNILERATGGARQPEFASSHPSPANRRQHIEDAIQREFPNGLPQGLRR